MTNEEKAMEISDGWESTRDSCVAEKAAIKMAQWKDEVSNMGMPLSNRDEFIKKLSDLINIYGIDTICNVPDFILADLLWRTLINQYNTQDLVTWWRNDKSGNKYKEN